MQCHGVKYIHIVQPSPPSPPEWFSFCKTETLTPWNNSPFLFPKPLAIVILLYVSRKLILQVPHVSGIIQHLCFCDWLISFSIMSLRFIHVVAPVQMSFLFKAEQHSIVCVNHILFSHSFADTWVAFTSWLLWIMMLRMSVYKYVFEILLSILLGICPVAYMICKKERRSGVPAQVLPRHYYPHHEWRPGSSERMETSPKFHRS